MRKIVVVYNPRSSRFKAVEGEVFEEIRKVKGVMVGRYEIKPTSPEDNAGKLAKLIGEGDLVLAVGGDGTATIAMNGMLESGFAGELVQRGEKEAIFAALPYGNFNDLPRALGDLTIDEVLKKYQKGEVTDFYPLDIKVNKKHFRYAGCYVTVGMFAEATDVFEKPKVRGKLKTGKKGIFFSGRKLFSWYLRNKGKNFFPDEVIFNSTKVDGKVTDYVAVNGMTMGKIVKVPLDRSEKEFFRVKKRYWSGVGNYASFWKLLRIGFFEVLLRKKLPGGETERDLIQFKKPAAVTIHAEGEAKKIAGVLEIEVRKLEKPMKVIRIERKK